MDMALSAKPRVGNFQQPIVDRSVRFMTVGTIFQDRRMFPQEWPTSFRVACVTIFVDAVLPELRRIRAAMGIMAVGANDLALPERHMR